MDSNALITRLCDNWFFRLVFRPLLIAYILLFLFALTFSDSLIFQNGPSSYEDSVNDIKLTTSDGVKITARYLPNPDAVYTILYSHGNGEDLGDDSVLLENLRDLGFAVFAYDYHGYGTSGGRPSEENTYRDIDAAYGYLTFLLRVPPERIIIYGRSLGGGPSVDLATREPAAGLILESAFISAFRARTQIPVLPIDKYRSLAKMPRVHCPVLVIHGTADWVIPFQHGKKLYAAANEPKRCLWVKKAGHNDLIKVAGESYTCALHEFVTLLPAVRP